MMLCSPKPSTNHHLELSGFLLTSFRVLGLNVPFPQRWEMAKEQLQVGAQSAHEMESTHLQHQGKDFTSEPLYTGEESIDPSMQTGRFASGMREETMPTEAE